jgi:chemotaxis protein methyltransferase CheR
MICREEAARLAGWKLQILATDISREMIERAREGIYTQFEVQRGLPAPLLIKYFAQDGERWQIKPEIRAAVQYREFNLLDDPRMLGRFDIIFCRNVLIYFDQPTKQKVLDRASTILAPDGALFLGAAETVIGVSQRFTPVTDERGVYRPVVEVAKAGAQVAREARVAAPAMAG